MKSLLLAAALTVGSAAIAQSAEAQEMQPPGQDQTMTPPAEDVMPPETNPAPEPTPPQPAEPAQPPQETMPSEQTMPTMPPPAEPSTPPTPDTMAQPAMPPTSSQVEPGNTKPERDARGIAVISAPATAPAGANQAVSAPAGAQVVANPNQSQVFASMAATGEYPACSRTVTDHCVQKYERSRRR